MMVQNPSSAQLMGHPHEAELKKPDGSWKHTNALSRETSPYLLQHAHNPVQWYSWGTEAFELAKQANKPIFLSVGYATCYWCHVMERQVFENPQLAAILNEHFVSIKVDREERPDVDDIYMTSVQLMTGHGGWPMSVFLTPPGAGGPDDPGLKPFWAGTYIPPQPRHGMPGFGDLIEGLSRAWREQQPQVIEQANRVMMAVQEQLTQQDDPVSLTHELLQHAAGQLMRIYDPRDGGFGHAPKFPQPTNLLFLLKVYHSNPSLDAQLWTALAYTLERMALGGMYDQVGGGFHRYSTDTQWLVPHFEKMLYDNAQLVEAYLTAYAIKPTSSESRFYRQVVRETCDYVLREMTDEVGAFWSAQDAEVDAREGGNYLWTREGIEAALGDDRLTQLAVRMYGLDKGTNFQDPHHENEPPMNVLYLPVRLDKLAESEGVALDQLLNFRRQINKKMLAVRDRRKQPLTDDKVLVAWNGLMIAALARAGDVFDEQRYIQAAAKAARYVLDHMRTPSNPRYSGEGHHSGHTGGSVRGLFRTMRGGDMKIGAFLEDYAFFVHGLIELHRATKEDGWLENAQSLTSLATHMFNAQVARGGGYYDTLADQTDLFVRTVSIYDGALPTGNSQMIHNLLDLYELTKKREYLDRAILDLHAFSGSLAKRGAAMVHMCHALLRTLNLQPDAFDHMTMGRGDVTDVVAVTVKPKELNLSSGSTSVQVTLVIQEGFHVNAGRHTGLIGLIPTVLELVDVPGFALDVVYPEGIVKRYPFADEAIRVYEGTVVVDVTIRPVVGETKNTVDGQVHGGNTSSSEEGQLVLRYQVCTETSCLEPKEMTWPVTFQGLHTNP